MRSSPETGGCGIPRYSQQGISVLLGRNPANAEIYSGAFLVSLRHKNDESSGYLALEAYKAIDNLMLWLEYRLILAKFEGRDWLAEVAQWNLTTRMWHESLG
jgi:hypothetical protein